MQQLYWTEPNPAEEEMREGRVEGEREERSKGGGGNERKMAKEGEENSWNLNWQEGRRPMNTHKDEDKFNIFQISHVCVYQKKIRKKKYLKCNLLI